MLFLFTGLKCMIATEILVFCQEWQCFPRASGHKIVNTPCPAVDSLRKQPSFFSPGPSGVSRRAGGPFLESPGNLTGPKSYFEIKVSRNVGCVLTSNEVHFVSLANNFTVQFSNLLKLPSGMENRTA